MATTKQNKSLSLAKSFKVRHRPVSSFLGIPLVNKFTWAKLELFLFVCVCHLVTFTKSLTWVMMTKNLSSPLLCHWRRETPSSFSPAHSKTWCWWTSRRIYHPSCRVRSVCVCSCIAVTKRSVWWILLLIYIIYSLLELFLTDCWFGQRRHSSVVCGLWTRTQVNAQGPQTRTGGKHKHLMTCAHRHWCTHSLL